MKIQEVKNIHSGVRCLSVIRFRGGVRLGVNIQKGQDIGSVNRYRVEFNNGQCEPLIDCLDKGLIISNLFPKKVRGMDEHIDTLLNKEGYFTEWEGT